MYFKLLVTAVVSSLLISLSAYAAKVTYVFTCPVSSEVTISGSSASGYIAKTFNGQTEQPVLATGTNKISGKNKIGPLTALIIPIATKYGHHRRLVCSYGYVNKNNAAEIHADLYTSFKTECRISAGRAMSVTCTNK